MKQILILFMLFSVCLYGQDQNEIKTIQNKMIEQEESWNKGEIKEFMNHYWKSDSLSFTGKNGSSKWMGNNPRQLLKNPTLIKIRWVN